MGHNFSQDKSVAPVKNLLVFEVLGGHVLDAKWRLGDWWTKGVLGLSRPYIKVELGAQVEQSMSAMTFLVQSGCDVNFNKRIVFNLDESPDVERIKLTVRDQRNVQSAVRGDPLIGRGEVGIDQALAETLAAGKLVQARVELRRDDSEDPTGWLNVQYRVIKTEVVRDTMLFLGARSLRDIANAMVGVLNTPDGMKRLLDARPKEVASATSMLFGGCSREEKLRKRIEPIATSFCGEADNFCEKTDDEVLRCLALLSREILKLVSDFAQLEKGGEPDTVALASEWLSTLFLDCAEVDESVASSGTSLLGGEMLHRWFTSSHIDPDSLEPVDTKLRKIVWGSQWTVSMQPPDQSILGRGAYACVFRARDRHTKQVCAVKQIKFQAGRGDKSVTMRDCEVAEVLRSNIHPCVVRLFGVHMHSETCAALIMEYCPGGDLQSAILSHKKLNIYKVPPQAKKWLSQIFLGLEFLHLSVGMLVRDVKPQNVILTKGGSCAKLTDFGVSRLDTVADGAFSFQPGLPPGSPLYAAPEVIKGDGYDYHADLYSLAVLAWVLYTGGLVSPVVPVPPCAEFDQRRGPAELLNLLDNWQMLRACIMNPEESDAHQLPSEDIKDFILRLTDRKEDYQQVSHGDVRSHPLLQDMALPPYDNAAEVAQWLRNHG